ncbi:family 20 glycosylhydrolase, partial [Bacteroides nordii]|uniref:family 20 glycosylhydrolase n=1 Tax=Bacteroides nordii TaxID=291645 RepID=UPI00210943B0
IEFIEDVVGEVADLFAYKYVLIGGDEAPRIRWAKCPKCQARIKEEGLKADAKHKAEDRLQSYCMQRAEKFLISKG